MNWLRRLSSSLTSTLTDSISYIHHTGLFTLPSLLIHLIMTRRFSLLRWFLLLILGVFISIALYIPYRANLLYGAAASTLDSWQLLENSTKLLLYNGILIQPVDPNGADQSFRVEQNEPVFNIALRLKQAGLIRDDGLFVLI